MGKDKKESCNKDSKEKEKIPESVEKHGLRQEESQGEQESVQESVKSRGRPSIYTEETAKYICEQLSEGIPLAHICREENMPAVRTVSDWKVAHPEFAAAFARAREDGFDKIAADCLDIADETALDTVDTENGERPNAEWIARSKLRVETRLKLLSKWDPKRYGERQTVDMNVTNPLADRLARARKRNDG